MATTPRSILALDIGDKRVGVAVASLTARLPQPLQTLRRGDNFLAKLQQIIAAKTVATIVVGLPRGLEGQTTQQTKDIQTFVEQLQDQVDVPIRFQDEALTSRQAEDELEARKKPYRREDIDALAAVYILKDFLAEQQPIAQETS